MTDDAIRAAEIQRMRTRLWESTANCEVRADFEALLERSAEKDAEIAHPMKTKRRHKRNGSLNSTSQEVCPRAFGSASSTPSLRLLFC